MNIHEMRVFNENSWRRSYPEFVKIIKARDCKVGVEVGVAFGGHAEAILEQTGVTMLFGVDPYEHREGYDDFMNLTQPAFDNMYWYMIGRMSRFGRYVHSRERSSVAAELAIGSFDFIYIDANHSYEEVREDLRLWFPKVKLGGIIGGHDYGFSAFPGVKQAVDEFCAKHRVKLNVEPQTVWWAEKPLASPPA